MYVCVPEWMCVMCALVYTCIHTYTGVVEAIDKAWEMDKHNCVRYYR